VRLEEVSRDYSGTGGREAGAEEACAQQKAREAQAEHARQKENPPQ
jgi:hypothetical protein